MVKIFLDHQKFSSQIYGGISRYFANLIDEIKNQDDFEYLLGVLYSDNHYIKNEIHWFKSNIGRRIMRLRQGKIAFLMNQKYCEYLLDKNDFDIFHPTYYDPYFIGRLKKPMVTTVHDMTYEMLPEYFWANDRLTLHKRISIERADRIIAISETTKRDLLNLTNIKEDKIEVIHHGIDISTPLKYESIADIPKKYMLYVGDRSGYKNFYLFIRAFAAIHNKYPDLKIVLTGGGNMGIADVEFISRLNLEIKIIHVQATDGQLNFLYKNALFFVYPSLYEGFGFPILESFRAQCPMLLSDTSCFREIASDAAVFFEPYSLDDLISKIEQLYNDDELRQSLVKNGSLRLLDFPLEKCNLKTLNLYKSLI